MSIRSIVRVSAENSASQILQYFHDALQGGSTLIVDPQNLLYQSDVEILQALPSDTSLLLPTSGSSGNPKFVIFSKASLLASAKLSCEFLMAQSGDTWSLLLPLTHIAGFNVLARSIYLESELITETDLNADFTAIVPTQLHRALFPKNKEDEKLFLHLISCKAVLVGGAALSNQLKELANDKGVNVVTTYGSSETSGGCIYDGVCLPGVNYKISNDGVIQISGPTLATGYLSNQNLQITNFPKGWYQSNDSGEVIEDKLVILGRADDVIISGGEKISLIRLENLLQELFPNIQFLAGKLNNPEWGEQLVLLYQGEIEAALIREFIKKHLPNYYLPKQIKKVDQLPTISIGKPARNLIAQYF